jgi:anti-sigma factor RsiW
VTLSDEKLMAYVDGELDDAARAEVEAALLGDPALAQRVAAQKALRSRIRLAFDNVAKEPVPDRLVKAARAAPARAATVRDNAGARDEWSATPSRDDVPARRDSNVVPLRRKPSRRWSWPEWSAIAASLLVGVLASQLFFRVFLSGPGPVISRDGQMIANTSLSHALSEQLAANQPSTSAVQIGISFRSRAGNYCRTFTTRGASAVGGLACRAGDAWRVQVLAQGEKPAQSSGGLRQASSSMPKAIAQAVDEEMAGDPLDASGEAAAKQKNWNH